MKILILGSSLFLATTAAAPAQGLGEENCRATSEIVAAAVAARSAGDTPADVKARLTAGGMAVKGPYRATVAPLVDWVFGLNEAMLSADLAESYEIQCLQYEE